MPSKTIAIEVFSVYDCGEHWCFFSFPAENLEAIISHGVRLPDYFVYLDEHEHYIATETCAMCQSAPFLPPIVEYLKYDRMN